MTPKEQQIEDMTGQYNTLTYTPTGVEADGIDLFTERVNGAVQTTIYKRYDGTTHGGRVFARSVDPTSDSYHDTMNAWTEQADSVRDFRPSEVGTTQSARLLLSGAVGAVRASTEYSDLTAATIAETIAETLTEQEAEILRSTLNEHFD